MDIEIQNLKKLLPGKHSIDVYIRAFTSSHNPCETNVPVPIYISNTLIDTITIPLVYNNSAILFVQKITEEHTDQINEYIMYGKVNDGYIINMSVNPPIVQRIIKDDAKYHRIVGHFIHTKCITDPTKSIPQKTFIMSFNSHCTENNLGRIKFAGSALKGLDIKVVSDTYRGKLYINQPFIFGLDVKYEDVDFTDDY